jgi:2-polyprenyl-6-hydroxyphenyl methylase / 3-demethylubiquinone-9 3-methyltransferase
MKNVDPDEIIKFESMAHQWWDRNGVMKSLHDINPLRLSYINSRITLKDKRVLDVGCGGGILSEALALAGARVTGIDMAGAHIEAAKQHMHKTGVDIDYHKTRVEDLVRSHPEAFDAVICLELLEHVPQPASIVNACAKVTRPGGDIIFATLNRNPKSYVFAIIGAEYLLRLLPIGTHQWSKFVKPSEIRTWASRAGVNCVDFTGMHYNPFTRRYSLGGNLHVNYLVHLKSFDNIKDL